MRRLLYILLLVLPFAANAQSDSIITMLDTVFSMPDTLYAVPDTAVANDDYRYHINLQRKPDAVRAVWLGALFPGLGQIYNRSFWKLPIVYGGLMGCAYAIMWNEGKYSDYKEAYRDLYIDNQNGTVSSDPDKSYNAVLPNGYTIDRMGGAGTYTNTLQNWQSTYRRYRDISIVATVVVYALSLIDAYVDAQLFDFDISPDLSLQVDPQLHQDPIMRQTAELHLAITF